MVDFASVALVDSLRYNRTARDSMRSQMISLFLLLFSALPLYTVLSGEAPLGRDFRTADRSSAGLAPPPDKTPEAVVQIY
jgi:hypothetical protein